MLKIDIIIKYHYVTTLTSIRRRNRTPLLRLVSVSVLHTAVVGRVQIRQAVNIRMNVDIMTLQL